jgi:rhamnosyltransferase
MKDCGVCAVIVTFHPQATALENLAKVRTQVQGLVVIDNGSPEGLLAPFHAAKGEQEFVVIENGANLGIAAALNIGVRWAATQGFRHVILFDQDSTVTDGFIDAMRSTYRDHARRDEIAIVMPRYRDRECGRISKSAYLAVDGAPLEVMTSGSYIPLSTFSKCGGFREDFFIDQVDHEFAFRVRQRGLIVAVSEQAILLHVPGSPRRHSFLGLRSFNTTHHNAMRRYYMTRNGLLLARQYWNIYPAWSRNTVKTLLLLPIVVVLAEREKWRKLRNILLGALDAVGGRRGNAGVI